MGSASPDALYLYDDSFRRSGFRRVAGIDEAGRGPIAGPVVAAAVVLPPGLKIERLRDSKKVPEAERKTLFYEILYGAEAVGVGISEADLIDRINILRATRLAMEAAVRDITDEPDILLIDAVKLPSLSIRQECPVRGESKSASIAAASIVAKFVRDALMLGYHGVYPQYGFDRHKGYGTKEHLENIALHGPCPIHRMSFDGVMTRRLPY